MRRQDAAHLLSVCCRGSLSFLYLARFGPSSYTDAHSSLDPLILVTFYATINYFRIQYKRYRIKNNVSRPEFFLNSQKQREKMPKYGEMLWHDAIPFTSGGNC